MQKYSRAIQVGVLVTGAILFFSTAVKPQAPAARPQNPAWEYSSVRQTGEGGEPTDGPVWNTFTRAEICYATAQGCRVESLTSRFPNDDTKNSADAIMQAAHKLGDEGWELVTAGVMPLDGRRVLYFRRPKNSK